MENFIWGKDTFHLAKASIRSLFQTSEDMLTQNVWNSIHGFRLVPAEPAASCESATGRYGGKSVYSMSSWRIKPVPPYCQYATVEIPAITLTIFSLWKKGRKYEISFDLLLC